VAIQLPTELHNANDPEPEVAPIRWEIYRFWWDCPCSVRVFIEKLPRQSAFRQSLHSVSSSADSEVDGGLPEGVQLVRRIRDVVAEEHAAGVRATLFAEKAVPFIAGERLKYYRSTEELPANSETINRLLPQ